MSVINTNVKSMFAQAALQTNERHMSVAMNQLSTGKRTYSAQVDAAGVSISEKLTSQIRGSQMAVRNINDAISFMQTAEGSLNEIGNMAQRMYELAVQKATGTFDTDQVADIEAEMTALAAGIESVTTGAKWNGLDVAIETTLGITPDGIGSENEDLELSELDDTPDSDSGAADISAYIATVTTRRAEAGAHINRLGYMADNLSNLATNLSASRSRIQDTDYAAASAELARTQIINQAATAMLAQANQQPQAVLTLLQ
ncbi:MAG: flagellin [Limnohabitans sp.]